MVRPLRNRSPMSTTARLLAFAVCSTALVVLLVRVGNREDAPEEPARSMRSKEVVWVCQENDEHRFKARFRYESLPCSACAGRCLIQLDYVCPEHGHPFAVFAKFARIGEQATKLESSPPPVISEYRYIDSQEWMKSEGTVSCRLPGCTTPARRTPTAWSATNAVPSSPDG